jgi:hypothetical protein
MMQGRYAFHIYIDDQTSQQLTNTDMPAASRAMC